MSKFAKLMTLIFVAICAWKALLVYTNYSNKEIAKEICQKIELTDYEIIDHQNIGSIIDQDIVFVLRLKSGAFFGNGAKGGLSKSDADDRDYFVRHINKTGVANLTIGDYELYRGDYVLDKTNLCSDIPCNVSVLYSRSSNIMFLEIYKA